MTGRRQGIPTRRATLALMGAAAVSACGVEPRIPYRPDDRAATPLLSAAYRIRTDAAIEDYPPDLGPRFRENGRSYYLAISGGGANGAFGAGVPAGWTASGTRPTFSVISGVSTGALIAPLAFLGPEHDVTLRNLYTGGVAEGIGGKPSLLRGVAQEHARGRRLLVFTTDLDAQLGVIWNMGAIAGSGDPGALSLFEDVLMASAAIPGCISADPYSRADR